MARSLALIVALLAALASSASASAGTSALERDGFGTLIWAVTGDAENSTAKTTTRGCDGQTSSVGCLGLFSQYAPPDPPPPGCTVLGCDPATFSALVMDGGVGGAFHITTTPGRLSTDGYYRCLDRPTTIRQHGFNGGTFVRDGCVQTVECEIGYDGWVDADVEDVVARTCRWLTHGNETVRREPRPKPDATPSPATSPPSAPPLRLEPALRPSAPSPLLRVAVRVIRARHGLAVEVRLRRGAPITIRVRQAAGRKRVVRSVSVRAGSRIIRRRVVGLPRGRHRVEVTSPGSSYALNSSPVVVG